MTTTWKAASAGWWAVSVIVSGIAVALAIVVLTLARLSAEEPATMIFRAGLQPVMQLSVERELDRVTPGEPRLRANHDLVRYDVDRRAAAIDPGQVAADAATTRAADLWRDGLPPDPGGVRTSMGMPRSVLEKLTYRGHLKLDGLRVLAVGLALGALGWTALQARRDNAAALLAGALTCGWLLAQAGLAVTRTFIVDTGQGGARMAFVVDRASSVPMAGLRALVIAALGAAAVYRFAIQGSQWWQRRAVVATPVSAEPIDASVGDEPAIARPAPAHRRRPLATRVPVPSVAAHYAPASVAVVAGSATTTVAERARPRPRPPMATMPERRARAGTLPRS